MIRGLIRSLLLALVLAGSTAYAASEEFVKVEGKASEEIPAGKYVAIAYSFIWVAMLGYVMLVSRRLGRVRNEIEALRATMREPETKNGDHECQPPTSSTSP